MCNFLRSSQTVSKAAELVYAPAPGLPSQLLVPCAGLLRAALTGLWWCRLQFSFVSLLIKAVEHFLMGGRAF